MPPLPPAQSLAADIGACLGFYTRLPAFLPSIETRRFAEAHWAAPVAGLVIGFGGALVFWTASALDLPPTIAAALSLAATMAVSGCLHEDGLADVADGFGGGATRERKLEIMRDSRIGTYGVAALAVALLLRWSALAALAAPALVFPAMIAAHAASRALLPGFMALVPRARPDGLSAGVGAAEAPAAAAAMIGAVLLLICLGPAAGLIAVFALGLWFMGLKWLCQAQIGGQTGDVLGTLQQGGEVVVLFAACIFFI
jgi:adenosylcobinamide-GDP ribazoletransferase